MRYQFQLHQRVDQTVYHNGVGAEPDAGKGGIQTGNGYGGVIVAEALAGYIVVIKFAFQVGLFHLTESRKQYIVAGLPTGVN